MSKLKVLDLFSGIGGFSLGLERTGGFETVAFCEIEEYPRRVLEKHWPGVPIYHDVRELTADALRRDGIAVDVICGGFPCQDLSFAGKRAGLEGARSGLWGEYGRIIGEVRPRFVIVENVPGLLSLGMGTVLGDLSALGYDAVWDCVPASAVGAHHRRDRVWLVAYTDRPAIRQQPKPVARRSRQAVAIADCSRPNASPLQRTSLQWSEPNGDRQRAKDVAHATGKRSAQPQKPGTDYRTESRPGAALRGGSSEVMADTDEIGWGQMVEPITGGADFEGAAGSLEYSGGAGWRGWWLTEPDVGRVADGVPSRVDRLRCLGNSVVPQIPELIGRAILQAEGMSP